MGIGYTHWFAVKDLERRPGKAQAEAVHAVLERWGLIRGKPRLFVRQGRGRRELQGAEIAAASELPADLVLQYEAVGSSPRLAQVLGHGPAGPIEYVQATAVFYTSFLLLQSFATLEVEVVAPAITADGEEVEEDECLVLDQRRFIAGPDATPPRVIARFSDPRSGLPVPGPEGYTGVMRAGVCLKPGYQPDWVCGDRRERARWPNRDLARDLEAAFGSPLAEVGLLT